MAARDPWSVMGLHRGASQEEVGRGTSAAATAAALPETLPETSLPVDVCMCRLLQLPCEGSALRGFLKHAPARRCRPGAACSLPNDGPPPGVPFRAPHPSAATDQGPVAAAVQAAPPRPAGASTRSCRRCWPPAPPAPGAPPGVGRRPRARAPASSPAPTPSTHLTYPLLTHLPATACLLQPAELRPRAEQYFKEISGAYRTLTARASSAPAAAAASASSRSWPAVGWACLAFRAEGGVQQAGVRRGQSPAGAACARGAALPRSRRPGCTPWPRLTTVRPPAASLHRSPQAAAPWQRTQTSRRRRRRQRRQSTPLPAATARRGRRAARRRVRGAWRGEVARHALCGR